MCSILEDETNKNQFADEFFISCIEEVRQLKHTRKKKLNTSFCWLQHNPSYVIIITQKIRNENN